MAELRPKNTAYSNGKKAQAQRTRNIAWSPRDDVSKVRT